MYAQSIFIHYPKYVHSKPWAYIRRSFYSEGYLGWFTGGPLFCGGLYSGFYDILIVIYLHLLLFMRTCGVLVFMDDTPLFNFIPTLRFLQCYSTHVLYYSIKFNSCYSNSIGSLG